MASAKAVSAWFDAETDEQSNPERGAVAVESEQLTFTSDSVKTTVPLSAVIDVRVEHIPRQLGPIPPGQVPITLVYDDGDSAVAATVAAKGDVIRPLTLQVLETLLTGERIRVIHPAELGQERTSASFTRGTLTPTDGVLHFETDQGGKLDTSNVTSFERVRSESEPQQLVRVRFVRQGRHCRTDVQMTNERAVSLFGRYLDIQTELSTD